MSKRLFWKFCLIIATGVVALFWIIDVATSLTQEGMSFIDVEHRNQIRAWGREAERLYLAGDKEALEQWMQALRERENTRVSIGQTRVQALLGDPLPEGYYDGHLIGRDVDWQIHLYFKDNPLMEVPFSNAQTGFLIQLPDRMRPGSHLQFVWLILQIILPMMLLGILSVMLYRHIMIPLRQLEKATHSFSRGQFDVRVRQLLGKRNDELSELADTFDQMAQRIGEQIIRQRQLIADISHELRTPLTRLDIAVQNLKEGQDAEDNLDRLGKESRNIRKLVDDSLTLAWLENEQPELTSESLDLTDLLDVLVEDARFEFPDRDLELDLPSTAEIHESNHQCIGQALENVLRNALRFTPPGKSVTIRVMTERNHYTVVVQDQGPGLPHGDLHRIFEPFFRSGATRDESSTGFGLGLALARRQIAAVGGTIHACNPQEGGLGMTVTLPKRRLPPQQREDTVLPEPSRPALAYPIAAAPAQG